MLSTFIFEEILCRWGAVSEIVTDNSTAYIAALDWLADRYSIYHIRILVYNLQANGVVERQHRTVCDSIFKACDGDSSRWPVVAPFAFWADRATIHKSTGFSPFYMAHGVEPTLPFDITQATFLIPDLTHPLSTEDLIATCTCQLQKRPADLATIHNRIHASRLASVRQFEKQYATTIRDYDFAPGLLVLVRNIHPNMDKMKLHYLGPMVVLRRMHNGTYRLGKLDGTVSRLCYAAFRLIPYHTCSPSFIPVTHVVDAEALASLNYNDTPIVGAVSLREELVTREGQFLNPPGDVTLGYAVGSEMSAVRPGSHHTESEPPFASCVTVSCVT